MHMDSPGSPVGAAIVESPTEIQRQRSNSSLRVLVQDARVGYSVPPLPAIASSLALAPALRLSEPPSRPAALGIFKALRRLFAPRLACQEPKFKKRLVTYYECQAPDNHLQCMALARPYPSADICIFRLFTPGPDMPSLEFFGLQHVDRRDPRLGMLVVRGVQEALEKLELCLVANPLKASQQQLTIKVLNPALLPQPISGAQGQHFKDIRGKALRLPVERAPFLRLLAHHARQAHDHAVARGWTTRQTVDGFADYFTWATTASPRSSSTACSHWEPFTHSNSVTPL